MSLLEESPLRPAEAGELPSAPAMQEAVARELQQFEHLASYSRLEEELLSRQQDRGERKAVGQRLVGIVRAWLVGVFVLLMAHGLGSASGVFALPEVVLNTLLVTTTVNLIGLLYVIARYLYNDKWIPGLRTREAKPPGS